MGVVVHNVGAWKFAVVLLPVVAFWGALVWGLAADPDTRQYPMAWVLALLLTFPVMAGGRMVLDRPARIIVDDRGITDRHWGVRHIPWDVILDARIEWMPSPNLPSGIRLTMLAKDRDRILRGGTSRWMKPLARPSDPLAVTELGIRLTGTDADPDALLAEIQARLKPGTPS